MIISDYALLTKLYSPYQVITLIEFFREESEKEFCEQHGITADEIDHPDYALLFNIQYPGVVR